MALLTAEDRDSLKAMNEKMVAQVQGRLEELDKVQRTHYDHAKIELDLLATISEQRAEIERLRKERRLACKHQGLPLDCPHDYFRRHYLNNMRLVAHLQRMVR